MYQYDGSNHSKHTTEPLSPGERRRRKIARFVKYIALMTGVTALIGAAVYGVWSWSGEEDYRNSLNITGTDEGGQEGTAELTDQAAEQELQTAGSYGEIYEYLEALWDESSNSNVKSYATQEVAADAAVSSESTVDADMATSSSGSVSQKMYSDTNVRTEEVGEADIVKTDGNYLYISDGDRIRIVDIRDPQMKEAGCIMLESGEELRELYVKDQKMVVFYNRMEQKEKQTEGYDGGNDYQELTVAETFDVSNPEKPESLGEIIQSGVYDSVRLNDGYFYLFSNYYVSWNAEKRYRNDYIPSVQGELVKSDSIYLPQEVRGSRFKVVTSFSMEEPSQTIDSKAILSSGGNCYVGSEHIYIYERLWNTDESYSQTSIRKIRYENGTLKGVAQTKIWGTIKDSFCIDEYAGNLRVVTTVDPVMQTDHRNMFQFWSDAEEEVEVSTNALYILDEKFEVVGKIEKLAPDENVYSARFMGDIGYFVTYEQVDPLFSVDLSNPRKPRILGKLKIPGFSEYLHPYGKGRLLGIGMNADMEGNTNGVKLSMFDISDPTDVSEIEKEVLKAIYSTEIAYDYKMALIDPERNLIGFSAYGDRMHYYLYQYEPDTGFTCLLEKELSNYVYNLRGLYAEDTLYLVEGNAVESFSLQTFEKIDDIVL